MIDFAELFEAWGTKSDDLEGPLLNDSLFQLVQVGEDKTLEWPIMIEHLAFEGDTAVKKRSPLSFDPVVLYEASHPIENYRLVPVL